MWHLSKPRRSLPTWHKSSQSRASSTLKWKIKPGLAIKQGQVYSVGCIEKIDACDVTHWFVDNHFEAGTSVFWREQWVLNYYFLNCLLVQITTRQAIVVPSKNIVSISNKMTRTSCREASQRASRADTCPGIHLLFKATTPLPINRLRLLLGRQPAWVSERLLLS